jgi:hypothetical protein
LFGFLTTEANGIVAPIHPKAMPVILTTPEEADLWLEAETVEALAASAAAAGQRAAHRGARREGGRTGAGDIGASSGNRSFDATERAFQALDAMCSEDA